MPIIIVVGTQRDYPLKLGKLRAINPMYLYISINPMYYYLVSPSRVYMVLGLIAM
jgi:hypothetical protein